jgi:prenyltransferase beta subunit
MRSRLSPTGGFLDRNDQPDLYYTVFGLEGLQALSVDSKSDPGSAPLVERVWRR